MTHVIQPPLAYKSGKGERGNKKSVRKIGVGGGGGGCLPPPPPWPSLIKRATQANKILPKVGCTIIPWR